MNSRNDSQFENNFGKEYANNLPFLGQSINETLSFFENKNVYGVGGDFAANIISALEKNLNVLPSSNEMHAGFSACGQAEITGMGVALSTYTVGSLPMTSAAALAKAEGLPVIFLSGCPGESEINNNTLHHTIISTSDWHGDLDCALNAFKSLNIRSERLQGSRSTHQPSLAGEQFFKLVLYAFQKKTPVYIEIPRDLLNQKTQPLTLPDQLRDLPKPFFMLSGMNSIADHVLSQLKNAKHPVIYLGTRLRLNHELTEKILQFCSQFNIPFTTTWLAKGIADETHPLSLGCYNGIFSEPTCREYIEKKMDYVIELDTSVVTFDINSALYSGTHFILNFDNKTTIKSATTSQQGLDDLFNQLLNRQKTSFEFTLNREQENTLDESDRLDFHNLSYTLNKLHNKHRKPHVYLPEVGSSFFASFGLQTGKNSVNRGWISNPWYGAMGTSLPYARAVSRHIRDSKSEDIPIVLTGDGGFNFQFNELVHFLREELSVIIIYMRNNQFDLGKSSDADIYNCSSSKLDTQALIQGFGGHWHRCETISALFECYQHITEPFNGIHFIEIPSIPEDEYQSPEMKLLNCFIGFRNGDTEATRKWNDLTKQE